MLKFLKKMEFRKCLIINSHILRKFFGGSSEILRRLFANSSKIHQRDTKETPKILLESFTYSLYII